MSQEDREEMYQDMLEEAREDEYLEVKMRRDYDFFMDRYGDEIALFNEVYNGLKSAHEEYDWEFDVRDILY